MSTVYAGRSSYVPGGNRLLHSGPGRVISLLVSHSEATPQALTLYDDWVPARRLAQITVAPGNSPRLILFPRAYGLTFDDALLIHAGNCLVHVTAVGKLTIEERIWKVGTSLVGGTHRVS